jgi:TPR repeat protein
MIDH